MQEGIFLSTLFTERKFTEFEFQPLEMGLAQRKYSANVTFTHYEYTDRQVK